MRTLTIFRFHLFIHSRLQPAFLIQGQNTRSGLRAIVQDNYLLTRREGSNQLELLGSLNEVGMVQGSELCENDNSSPESDPVDGSFLQIWSADLLDLKVMTATSHLVHCTRRYELAPIGPGQHIERCYPAYYPPIGPARQTGHPRAKVVFTSIKSMSQSDVDQEGETLLQKAFPPSSTLLQPKAIEITSTLKL